MVTDVFRCIMLLSMLNYAVCETDRVFYKPVNFDGSLQDRVIIAVFVLVYCRDVHSPFALSCYTLENIFNTATHTAANYVTHLFVFSLSI